MSDVSKTTLDDLALMVAKGFENTATKKDVQALDSGINDLGKRVDGMDARLDRVVDDLRVVKTSVERIEKEILADQQRKLSILEERIHQLEVAR